MSEERTEGDIDQDVVASLVDSICRLARSTQASEVEVRQLTRCDSMEHEVTVTVRMPEK